MSTVIAMPQPGCAFDKPQAGSATYPPSHAPEQDPASESKPPQLVARDISRTPSPTPSENGIRKKRSWQELLRLYLTIAVIITIIALVETYHEKIITALKPVTNWLHDTPAGWLIPIVVLTALSFPPLFGHEIVAMLCGLVWGLGPGFGIVAAGTLLGEICTFYAFRLFCRARGEKLELTNMIYGMLAQVVREGGLTIAIIIRYSALPPHSVVSLPKQLVVVYIGVALGSNDSKSNKIQKIVLAVSIVITVLVLVYVRWLMGKARPAVVYGRRKARQVKLQAAV